MLRAVGIFNRTKNARPFKDYYGHWFNTLKNNLLPLLRRSLSHPDSPTVLSTHVDLLHQHFQSLYHALDIAASNDDVALLLFPDWRSSLEKPLIWIGDLHPYLFTNLVRCFFQEDDDLNTTTDDFPRNNYTNGYFIRNSIMQFQDRPWQVAMAWSNPSEELATSMDEIERGLRVMVPLLTTRMRNAEAAFVDRVVERWYPCRGRKEEAKVAVGSILTGHMEELVSIFLDANRLRRSVIGEIVGKTSVSQAALFLEALAEFLIGFRDQELVTAMELCKASTQTRDARPRHR